MNRKRLLLRLTAGALQNVRFGDMLNLTRGFGFRVERVSGSHHIPARPGTRELINLQNVDGQAKPYQIRQFIRLVEKYNLRLEDENNE